MARQQPSEARRKAIAEWLTANSINPCDVPLHSTITIGTKTISYDAYLRDADGRLRHDPATDDAAQERRTAPLITRPPDRWPA